MRQSIQLITSPVTLALLILSISASALPMTTTTPAPMAGAAHIFFGPKALRFLGSGLSEVPSQYNLPAATLAARLNRSNDLGVDRNTRAFFSCPGAQTVAPPDENNRIHVSLKPAWTPSVYRSRFGARPRPPSTPPPQQTRRMLRNSAEDNDITHTPHSDCTSDHHHHHHDLHHDLMLAASRAPGSAGLPAAPDDGAEAQRQLRKLQQQVPGRTLLLPDPPLSSIPTTSTGLPLLHRWALVYMHAY